LHRLLDGARALMDLNGNVHLLLGVLAWPLDAVEGVDGVKDIVARRHPLKVHDPVVGLDAIDVIDLRQLSRWLSVKGESDKAMNVLLACHALALA